MLVRMVTTTAVVILLATAVVAKDDAWQEAVHVGRGAEHLNENPSKGSENTSPFLVQAAHKIHQQLVDEELSVLRGSKKQSAKPQHSPALVQVAHKIHQQLVERELANIHSKEQAEHPTVFERLGHYIADKLNMQSTAVAKADKDKCKDAPKMLTALLLQIFLGYLGVGFGYMGRWDLFGLMMGLILGPCIISCIAVCCCKKAADGDEGEQSSLLASGGACGALSACLVCLVPFAQFGVLLWSIIAIANYSIDCGNGCPLQS